MERFEQTFRIKTESGLHARPATVFARVAEKYKSKILVRKDDEVANAKSVLGLMMLAAGPDEELTVTAEGPDARMAIEGLGNLILHNFEEEKQ